MSFFFVAQLPDGREMREPEVAWDDVPKGITALSIQDENGRVVVGFKEQPTARRLFFCNEGVAVKSHQGMLSAKLIGYVEDDLVHEWRLDLITDSGIPQLTRRQYPFADFEFGEGSLRSVA
jgi:hypothetical protein